MIRTFALVYVFSFVDVCSRAFFQYSIIRSFRRISAILRTYERYVELSHTRKFMFSCFGMVLQPQSLSQPNWIVHRIGWTNWKRKSSFVCLCKHKSISFGKGISIKTPIFLSFSICLVLSIRLFLFYTLSDSTQLFALCLEAVNGEKSPPIWVEYIHQISHYLARDLWIADGQFPINFFFIDVVFVVECECARRRALTERLHWHGMCFTGDNWTLRCDSSLPIAEIERHTLPRNT